MLRAGALRALPALICKQARSICEMVTRTLHFVQYGTEKISEHRAKQQKLPLYEGTRFEYWRGLAISVS